MSVLALSCLIFGLGLYGVLVRRDIIALLASVEVMLGGALVLLVALGASVTSEGATPASVEGVALVTVVVIAAEAAVGLALLVAVARRRRATRTEDLTEVKG